MGNSLPYKLEVITVMPTQLYPYSLDAASPYPTIYLS